MSLHHDDIAITRFSGGLAHYDVIFTFSIIIIKIDFVQNHCMMSEMGLVTIVLHIANYISPIDTYRADDLSMLNVGSLSIFVLNSM